MLHVQSTIRLKPQLQWLFPLTACLWIILLLGGCSAGEALPSIRVQELPEDTRLALQQLSQSSEKLYQAMKADDPVQARVQLESIARQFPALSLDGVIPAEGMEAVYVALGEARRTFNAAQFDPQKGLREAAKIRLLFDALSQPKHAMWKAYYKPMEDNARLMHQAAEEHHEQALRSAYEEFAGRYEMIKPSLAITHSPQMIAKADSMLVFLQARVDRNTPAYDEIVAVDKDLRQLLRELFGREASSADMPVYSPSLPINPVLYWGAAIGSFIITVLTFVGYRRYRYEKERPPAVRQNTDRE
ncbi:hypothetical protein XYCOK13_04030 [Xylanibacillus composti]|uniref:Sporulation protein YpjB n=1 Tax=Xylanibacillus composti TaxID=1572762 RepID=A0A8J4M0K6_9BACL|nr:hypothetical protein XYCOK13_04030 [Xylanibacillus composti]